MNSNNYKQEIEYQNVMISRLAKWLKLSMIGSSLSMILIYLFNTNVFLLIFEIVLLVITILSSIIIGFAIYNGQKNINKVIDAYASQSKG